MKTFFTKHKRLAISLTVTLAVILTVCVAFFIFISDSYSPDDIAMSVLTLDGVSKHHGYIELKSNASDVGLIFYPGAKVEYEAYLPLLNSIRENGINCYLVEMPFNMAFFGGNLADKVIDAHPEIGAWFICGHSLGGSFASGYASENADVIEGLILLGSYPYKEYPLEKTLTVYGSLNTSVADRVDYTENVIVIEGGNHAQFGNYGHQDGDAIATVSREHQQEVTVNAIIDFIAKSPKEAK